jgi:hypothetical protein
VLWYKYQTVPFFLVSLEINLIPKISSKYCSILAGSFVMVAPETYKKTKINKKIEADQQNK